MDVMENNPPLKDQRPRTVLDASNTIYARVRYPKVMVVEAHKWMERLEAG